MHSRHDLVHGQIRRVDHDGVRRLGERRIGPFGVDPVPAIEQAQPAEPVAVATSDVDLTEAAQPVVDASDAVAEPAAPPLAENALEGFFDLLSSFLSAATEGFEPGGGESSFRFFYSQSFNLEILRSVIEFKAPDEVAGAADTAATIIDGIVEAGDDD